MTYAESSRPKYKTGLIDTEKTEGLAHRLALKKTNKRHVLKRKNLRIKKVKSA